MPQNDNIAPFIIRIQTALEKGGIDGAKKELQSLQGETDKAEKSTGKLKDTTKKSADASVNAGQGFTAFGQAAATSSGGIGSMASALGGLTQQMPALQALAGPLGLAAAAVTALKVAVDAYYKAQDGKSEMVSSVQSGNVTAGLERIKQLYTDVVQKINDATDAAHRYYDAEASRDDSKVQKELARLDLDIARKRSELSPDDKYGDRRLNLEQAEARSSILDAAENRKNQRELNRIRVQGAAQEDLKSASTDRIETIEETIPRLSRQAQHNRLKAQKDAEDVAWWSGGKIRRQMITQSGTRLAEPLEAEIKKLVAELRQQNAQVSAADRELFSLTERAGAVLINQRETTPIKQQTSRVQRETTGRAIDVEERQQKTKQQKSVKEDTRYQDARKRTSETDQAFRQARGEQRSAPIIMEFLREYRAAKAEEINLFKQLQTEAKNHTKDIKNLRQNSARAGSGG